VPASVRAYVQAFLQRKDDDMRLAVFAVIGALIFSTSAAQADDTKAGTGKGKYLITATHTPEECHKTLEEAALQKKLLDKAEWGCRSGDHTMYLMTDAKSTEDAIAMLPENMRQRAKAVKLNKFTAAEIKKIHDKDTAAGK
jgi:hypothetical protein